MKQINIGTGVAILIVAYLLYNKFANKAEQAVEGGKDIVKNIFQTNDNVKDIVKNWFGDMNKNPFNPSFLKAVPGPVYWKGADVKRLAIAIHDNITNGKEVYRIISMAKYQQQIAQLAETYYNLYKVHMYKDIEQKLNQYNVIEAYVKNDLNNVINYGIDINKYQDAVLDVKYFHDIITFVNKLPKK